MQRPPDILQDVIPAYSVNLLAGAPGTGKSAFMAWWIQQFQRHLTIFDVATPVEPVYQAFIAADRSWDLSTARWFEEQGTEPFPHYSLQDDRAFKKARLRKRQDRISIFRECLDAVHPSTSEGGRFPDRSLIYVDPLALFLGGNLLDYDSCLVACSELRELCLERNVTIIGTAHASKQKADKNERYLRLQDRILGSAALFGYTDTQLYLASPEEVGRDTYVFLWHPHHAPARLFSLTRDDHGLFVPGQAIEEGRTKQSPPWIEALCVEPQTFQAIVEAATARGKSRMWAHRQLRLLQKHGRIMQPKRGMYQTAKPN